MMTCLVCGAGGAIGGHLARRLLDEGFSVRAVDIKPFQDWWQYHKEAENIQADLQQWPSCSTACEDIDYVYNLAAQMGGMGFIQNNRALCMLNVLINTHMLMAARNHDVKRYFFSSSACAYHALRQNDPHVAALKEEDVLVDGGYAPEVGYGEEKLFAELMCKYFTEDFGLETRVARFHNVYGPCSDWIGGREKAPAAICRKVAEAKLSGEHGYPIEVWGDGTCTRSFMWIGDCIEGIRRLMDSDVTQPLNIGSSELVTINQLIAQVESIAHVIVKCEYDLTKPQGVRGRNSDNRLIQRELGWEPTTPLREGLAKLYEWIRDEITKNK